MEFSGMILEAINLKYLKWNRRRSRRSTSATRKESMSKIPHDQIVHLFFYLSQLPITSYSYSASLSLSHTHTFLSLSFFSLFLPFSISLASSLFPCAPDDPVFLTWKVQGEAEPVLQWVNVCEWDRLHRLCRSCAIHRAHECQVSWMHVWHFTHVKKFTMYAGNLLSEMCKIWLFECFFPMNVNFLLCVQWVVRIEDSRIK